ncbi:hypothetical protein FKP32DRAFT_1547178, partial [Trametes sanguinea]
GPRYGRYVWKAVLHEVRARRVALDRSRPLEDPTHRLSFTSTGKRFYAEWNTIPLYPRGHPRLRYLSIRTLRKYSASLRRILDDMKSTFLEFHPYRTSLNHDNNLLNEVRSTSLRILRSNHSQNSELHIEVNAEEGQRRRLSRGMRL